MPLKLLLVLISVVGMEFLIAEDGIFQEAENGQKLQQKSFVPYAIDDSVESMYKNITSRKPGAPKYAAFKVLQDPVRVVIDEALVGSPAQTTTREEDKEYFYKMIRFLTDTEPRFILYAFGFTGVDGTKVDAIALIAWISDLADQTNQIIYNAMLDPMRQTLKVKVNDVVAYKKTDLNYDVIADEAEKSSK